MVGVPLPRARHHHGFRHPRPTRGVDVGGSGCGHAPRLHRAGRHPRLHLPHAPDSIRGRFFGSSRFSARARHRRGATDRDWPAASGSRAAFRAGCRGDGAAARSARWATPPRCRSRASSSTSAPNSSTTSTTSAASWRVTYEIPPMLAARTISRGVLPRGRRGRRCADVSRPSCGASADRGTACGTSRPSARRRPCSTAARGSARNNPGDGAPPARKARRRRSR